MHCTGKESDKEQDREPSQKHKKNKCIHLEKTLEEKGRLVERPGKDTILQLDAIIVTHPDGDHFGGINRLIKKCTINCPIITTEATQVTNARRKEVVDLPRAIKLIHPTKSLRSFDQITTESKIEKDDKFDFKTIKSNETSILFAVENILLTGDSTADQIYRSKSELNLNNQIFQVPHHGSDENSHFKKEKPKIHKDDSLHMILKHPATASAQFYSSILAHTYFISHGDLKKHHPHANVVTGIILAAVTRQKNCKLVFTGLFHEDKVNYPKSTEFEGFPQNWKEYVEIHVPVDVIETPYITITPDGTLYNTTTSWEEQLVKHPM